VGALMPTPPTIRRCKSATRHSAGAAAIGLDGWAELQIDYRWAGVTRMILESTRRNWWRLRRTSSSRGSAGAGPLRRATRTVPIVFTNVPDPVGGGLVESLARPGGNMTGFTPFEYGIGAKWLELLRRSRRTSRAPRFCVIQPSARALACGGNSVRVARRRNASEAREHGRCRRD